MRVLRQHLVGFGLLALAIGASGYRQSQDAQGSETSVNQDIVPLVCCVSVNVPSPEIALKVKSYMEDIGEFSPLSVAGVGVGSQVLPFSEGLFQDLTDMNLEPRKTCFYLSERHVLGKDVRSIYLGSTGEREAARPVAVRPWMQGVPPDTGAGKLFLLDSGLSRVLQVSCPGDPSISNNGEYIGIFVEENQGEGRWDIYNRSGAITAQVEVAPFGDGNPDRIILSNAGYCATIPTNAPFEGPRVDFYGPEGELIAQEIRSDWSGGYASGCFSDDGRYLLLVALYHSEGGLRSEVSLYSNAGERVWTFVPDEPVGLCSAASISRKGKKAIVSFDEDTVNSSKAVTYLLGKYGDCINKVLGFAARRVRFGGSEEYVLLCERSKMMVLWTFIGRTIFEHGDPAIGDADFAGSGKRVSVIEGKSVVLYDTEGSKLWSTRLPDVATASRPKIGISNDGREISLAVGNVFQVYRQWSKWEKADLETRRLPPDSFPELPQHIREYLKDHGYTIPQAYRPSRPHNVISGEFREKGITDFAVLASKNRSSCIMIFWGGSVENISRIREAKDRTILQGIGRGKIGFSRAIMVAKGVSVQKACRIYGEAESHEIKHDGIEDYFLGKASIIHCLVDGEWIGVLGAD
ncbi:hypothetical protein E3J62_09380 [candidate division TA06 bacterium]|uniref:Uncharacterized protein n=1 Tax=candidate division TA06 bacterium TaxID=2250710 RepID=A0A523UQH2_UNCT6|nr:MAG: hypothetical protein E3J62_09380 [candidate division TA06 bacterium]